MLYERNGHMIQLSFSDWQFANVNWIEFRFIELAFEVDYFCKTVEIYAALFGVRLRLVLSYANWIHRRD